MIQYCPNLKDCPFYLNWEKQTKDKSIIDVISIKYSVKFSKKGEDLYLATFDCLPLMALNETLIPMSDELKKRLSNPEQPKFECTHITLLNFLAEITCETRMARLDK